MGPTGQFLLVALEPGHPRVAEAYITTWSHLAYVVSVTDMAYVSQATLDHILLPASEAWQPKPKRPRRE